MVGVVGSTDEKRGGKGVVRGVEVEERSCYNWDSVSAF